MKVLTRNGCVYTGRNLDHIMFPMGGIGAGMMCLEGNGSFSGISIKHKPEIPKIVYMFASIAIDGKTPRIIEGDIPEWKIFGLPDAGNGLGSTNFGLPRCKTLSFTGRFPFATVKVKHPESLIGISICGWSPFIPVDADNSSLPVCAVEYIFKNVSSKKIKGVFGFHSKNFVAEKTQLQETIPLKDGFILVQKKDEEQKFLESSFSIRIPGEKTGVCQWCGSGGFSDTHQILWRDICSSMLISRKEEQRYSRGASAYTNVELLPQQTKTIKVLFSWYVPDSYTKTGDDPSEFYQPWYASRFKSIEDVSDYWVDNYNDLKEITSRFSDALFSSNIPLEIIDAVSSNLSIFKSPTMLRQKDGKLWCWEGCCDSCGCCAGSCTHVWNYCQATAHLFSSLERSLRETEFNENQNEDGHQNFRSLLPIRPNTHNFYAAADGQLGGIIKVYRDWRISGDDQWLRNIWHRVKKSIDYCISTWDPQHRGILEKPHHNTYDIEFWGPDGMCGSIYLGALKAIISMARRFGEDTKVYEQIYNSGRDYLENILFNGEYFEQKVMWNFSEKQNEFEEKYLMEKYHSRTLTKIIRKEGPPFQYGKGCLSDGVIGAWLSEVCYVGEILDKKKVKKHLLSVFRYNFKKDLSNHANLQRPGYALGKEGGLILCTWPKGNRPTLPFIYSDEVWTGFEYQVASHMLANGILKQALEIVKTARKRYDGTKRNPFDEYECGHWYGRALSSFALIQGLTGIRYDSIEKTLYMKKWTKKNFNIFFSTEGGWGIAGIKKGKPFAQILYGNIDIREIKIVEED